MEHVPKIVKIGGFVLKLYPVKLGTFLRHTVYYNTLFAIAKFFVPDVIAHYIVYIYTCVGRVNPDIREITKK